MQGTESILISEFCILNCSHGTEKQSGIYRTD